MKRSYWIRRTGALCMAMLLAVCLCMPASAESAEHPATEKQTAETQLSGSVLPHDTFQVLIPAEIALGSVSMAQDTVQEYEVRLELAQDAQSVSAVQITADPEVPLRQNTRSRGSLLCSNSLTQATLTPENRTQKGTLTIAAAQVQAALQGSYSGTLQFTITSTAAPAPTQTPGPSGSPAPTAAPTAAPTVTPMPTSTPTPTPTPAPTAKPTDDAGSDSASGNYTYKLSVRKGDDFSSLSMCDPLFYDRADVKVSGGNATVTLYVIDPIPKYASQENSPPLKDISLQYNGSRFSASMGSSHVAHSFAANSTFIGEAGVYNSLPLTFTVPYKAIKSSGSKTLLCTAYVNAVMKSTQNFYLVFSDGVKGETGAEGTPTPVETIESTQTQQTTTQTESDTTAQSALGSKTGIKDGTYQIPISAKKAASDEDSMMTQYLYKTADLTVNGSQYTLTIYIQHTVAGVEGGGPEYIRYNGTNAVKKENAKTISGTAYDSYTFSLKNSVPSAMKVDMYINAMSMEVSARLILDLSSLQKGSAASADPEEEAASQESDTAEAAGTKAPDTAKSAAESTGAGWSSLLLRAGHAWQGALYLLAAAAAGGGVYFLYKKKGL